MSSERDDKVKEFCMITGAGAEAAERLLSACNDDLEMAINMHMEGVVEPAGPSGSSSAETGDDDDVRAPIPQRQDTIVQPGYEGYHLDRESSRKRARVRSVFDGFRNFGNESEPSSQGGHEDPANKRKKLTLEELFKPPIDITFKGNFQSARDAATAAKKWLLVNIQDAGEFQCQVLNRDVWSSEAVKTVVTEHFLFWQQYKECDEAQRFLTFYPATEWPFVAVLDPRTGEKLVSWSDLDAKTFCDLVANFLELHPSLDDGASSSSTERKRRRSDGEGSDVQIIDADEDDQMAAAIRASLAESTTPTTKTKAVNDKGNVSNSGSELDFTDDDSQPSQPPTPMKKANGEPKASTSNGCSRSSSWEKYLGKPEDAKSSLIIRFPDGRRESISIPCSSRFMAIIQFVVGQGYPLERFEIVTNFPRRILTDLDENQTLKELGLHPQETIFVQTR